jgi:Phage terminase, small subunit
VLDRVFRKSRIGARGASWSVAEQPQAGVEGDLRAVADHPRPVVAEPPKPAGLGRVASEVWDQIVPELVRLKMVGRLDGPVVELFCTSFERWREHPGGPGYASLTSTVAHAARGLGLGAGARLRAEAPESDPVEVAAIVGTDL